ncbi:MAG: type II toxin-antitoxin system Phd/YefM family antitoxin [Anaerolineae bacterium]
MERIIPVSDLQATADKFIDQVSRTKEPIVITQLGRAVAMLVDYETYLGLIATLEEMSDPQSREKLERAKEASAKGEGVNHEQVVAEFRAKWSRGMK